MRSGFRGTARRPVVRPIPTTRDLRRSCPVASRPIEARAGFLERTYLHLFGAIAIFAALEVALFGSGLAPALAQAQLGRSWLLLLGGFLVVSWLASRSAHAARSTGAQYLALLGYVVAAAILVAPLLAVAQLAAPGTIRSAGLATLLGFTGLTFVAWRSRRDFSFLGGLLRWAGMAALLLIVAGALFGFELGTCLPVAMVALAGVAILHDTSNVLRHFPEDRHVAAALQLLASAALGFWYVLRLLPSRED